MAVYVDPLCRHGWVLRGRTIMSCHLFADTEKELHALAKRIGMKRSWYQPCPPNSLSHYDLTTRRREDAIKAGAIALSRKEAVAKWREERMARKTKVGKS